MQDRISGGLEIIRKRLVSILVYRLLMPLVLLALVGALVMGYVSFLSMEKMQQEQILSIGLAAEKHCQDGARMLQAAATLFSKAHYELGKSDLTDMMKSYGVFDTMYLLDENARIIATAPENKELEGMDFSGLSDLSAARNSGKVVFSRPFISLNTKAPTIPMILSIPGSGYLIGELNLSVLQEQILHQNTMKPGSTVYILDKNGTLLGHPEYRLVREQTNWAWKGIYQAGKNANTTAVFKADGVHYLGSTFLVSDLGWIVVEEIPLDVLILPYVMGIIMSFLIFVILFAGVYQTLKLSLSESLLEPLFDRAETEKSNRELAETNAMEKERQRESISKINQQLESMNQDLNHANMALNKEIQERTAAEQKLEDINIQLNQAMTELKEAQNQIIIQEKMAALGSLVAGISHEINTPVGISVTASSYLERELTQLSQLLMMDQLSRSDLQDYIEVANESVSIIRKNLRRADELITSFKTVAVNQSSDHLGPFFIQQAMDDIINSLRPKWKNTGYQVLVECPETLQMMGYPGALSQIITNLILNSLTHGFAGRNYGIIEIVFSPFPGGVTLKYTDDGNGMEPEVLKNMFTPFFTTRRNQGGTGLGMYIVYNLVTQRLQGEIQCSSTPGNGVEFIMTLPSIDSGQEIQDDKEGVQ